LTTALEGVRGQRPLFTPGNDPVPIVQEVGWAPGPVWTGAENLARTGIRYPDRPARSQSLYRLSYRPTGPAGVSTKDRLADHKTGEKILSLADTQTITTLPNTGRYPIKETTKSLTIANKDEAWKMEAAVAFVMWQYYNRKHGVVTQKSVFFKNRAHS